MFVDELNEEEKRHIKEGLKEPELSIFDLLCQSVALSEKERGTVKKLAKSLLEKLKLALVIDWRKKQRTKAKVQKVIDDTLQELPDSYDDNVWQDVCDKVYLHVYDKYQGVGQSVYSEAVA